MSDTKVSCSDFIVSAIRVIRPKPTDYAGRPNFAGIVLFKIVALATILYPDEVVRQSLDTLLANGIILLVAEKIVDPRRPVRHLEIISKIPPGAPLDDEQWFLNENGAVYAPERGILSVPEGYAAWLSNLMLYVIADGLPFKVTRMKTWRS